MELNARTISRHRVFPLRPSTTPVDAPLSIIDATVLNFAPCETVLFYDGPSTPPSDLLRKSLEVTLDSYPQWSGRLRRNDKTGRCGRLMLSYGRTDDPGVLLVVAETEVSLPAFPSARHRAEHLQAWDASAFPAAQLVPNDRLSTSNFDDSTLHSVLIQITTFGCGGMAVGLKFAHPLADAHSLSRFARDWAATTRTTKVKTPPNPLSPVFDPQSLDSYAGDVGASQPNEELVRKGRALPSHRYDWWISGANSPFPRTSTEVPEGLEMSDVSGTPMPWLEWDLKAPVSHYVLHFSRSEIQRLWQAVASSQPNVKVSRQDALLAHIWTCVNRARGLSSDDEPVHLDYTLGLRTRIDPPLSDDSLGSPLIIAAVSTTGGNASGSPSAMASLIRETVTRFTPENVRVHIYAKMYEQSPQRLWQAFLGRRHLLVTSWIHTHIWDVDFGCGRPRYVEAVMPKMDGLLQLMEGAPLESSSDETRHWSDDGVDAQLHLTTEAMNKLLRDPTLRHYSA